MAGSEASEDWVLIATACGGPTARVKARKPTRPPAIASGQAANQTTQPTAETIRM
jgi:hypothetical protein